MTCRKYRNTRKTGETVSPLNHCLKLQIKPQVVKNRAGRSRVVLAANDAYVRWHDGGPPMISPAAAWERWLAQ